MPPGFTKMFADRLNNQTKLTVSEAKTGDVIKTGHVLIAPGDKQMKVVKVGGQYQVECALGHGGVAAFHVFALREGFGCVAE